MKKLRWGAIIRVIISVGLMVFLLTQIHLEELFQHNLDPGLFAIGILIFWGYMLAWALRWWLLLRGAGENVPFGTLFRTHLLGVFLSLLLPDMVGMDVGRMQEMSRVRDNKVGVVSTVLLDRLLGLGTLIMTALVSLLVLGYQYVGTTVLYLIIVLAVGLIVGWLVFFNKGLMKRFGWLLNLPFVNRFASTIKSLYVALHQLQAKRRVLVWAVLMSEVSTLLAVTAVLFLARALGDHTDTVFFYIMMPIVWVVVALPISIGGLGVREAAYVTLFTQVGMDSSLALALSLMHYGMQVMVGVVGGLLWVYASLQALRHPHTDTSMPQDFAAGENRP
ncbi:MAG: flippase-like domain-containing protein [Anaerolineaceae bacterium]|nr:flippase-like domain-containing protein [Anaerolineaceae bacterium]